MNEFNIEHSAAPEPFLPPIGEAAPYPDDTLGPLRDIVRAVHDLTMAPLAIAAQSALGAASLAVQGHADVETLAGSGPTSLFLLTIAESGERKSSCDRLVMRGFDEKLKGDLIEHAVARKWYAAEMRAWEEAQRKLARPGKSETKEGEAARFADLQAHAMTEPLAPLRPERLASDVTIEGLVKYFLEGQPSMGLFNDEGGIFLGGFGMSAESRVRTVSGFSALWDGSSVTRTRSGDGTATIGNRRFGCHLMVQPVLAAPLLADTVAAQQGFLARFLLVSPASQIGKRVRHVPSPQSMNTVAAFAARITDLLSLAFPTVSGSRQELAPRLLPLSSEAKATLRSYYEEVELAQAPFCEFSEVRAFASKSAEQAARIAGVLTLFENIDAAEVSGRTMESAVTLASFYLHEAARLLGASAISAETRQLHELLRWLQQRQEEDFIISDIVQRGPNALRDTKLAKRLVASLIEHRAVVALPELSIVGGKLRKEAFKVVRG